MGSQENNSVVSVEDARKAEPIIREPDPLAIEEVRNNHATRMHGMQRGIIGWCVGSGPEKAGNVATLSIVACFAIIAAGFFKFDFAKEFDSFLKLVTIFLGIVGLALGYLFGAKENK